MIKNRFYNKQTNFIDLIFFCLAAFEGFNATILAYGQTGSGESKFSIFEYSILFH
jgi:hypothetical protein